MKIFRGLNWDSPKKLLADNLYKIIVNSQLTDFSPAYHNLKRNDSALYDLGPAALEFLGERLMVAKKYSAAAAVFQLQVEEDPGSAYGYFCLGRAFEKWGKVKDAIDAYKLAVQADPTSRAANDAAFQIRQLEKR